MTKTLRLLFLACGLAVAGTHSGPKSGPQPGLPAPAFSLPDLFHARGDISLKSLEGKVVLIDFWASWCPPCRKTVPDLARMRGRNPSLVVLALSIDEDRAKAMAFLKSRDTDLIYLHDAKREAAAEFDLGGMPSAYLIDRRGLLRSRFDGYTESDMKAIEAEVRKLLVEKP